MCTILSVIFHLEVSWFRSRTNDVTVYCCNTGIRFERIGLNLVCENALVFRYLNRQLIPTSKALLKNLKVTNSDKKRNSLLCCNS
jgi:hypothetical protein